MEMDGVRTKQYTLLRRIVRVPEDFCLKDLPYAHDKNVQEECFNKKHMHEVFQYVHKSFEIEHLLAEEAG